MKGHESLPGEPEEKTFEELAASALRELKEEDGRIQRARQRDFEGNDEDLLEREETDKIRKPSQERKTDGSDKKGGKKHKIERTSLPAEETNLIETPGLLESNIIDSKITNSNLEEKTLGEELSDLESFAEKLLQQGNLSRRRLILKEIERIKGEREKSSGKSSESQAA